MTTFCIAFHYTHSFTSRSYSCARELVLKQPTDMFVRFFMKRINLLLNNKVTPYVVFDGSRPDLKVSWISFILCLCVLRRK